MKGPTSTIVYGAIGIVVALGVSFWLEARLGRIGDRTDIENLARQVSETPKEIPNWKLDHDGNVDPEASKYLQCSADFQRRYVGQKNDRIMVGVLVGPSGPLSQHDPNTCYPANGYRTVKEPVREKFKVGDQEITFLTTVMQQGEVGGSKIKILWGWHDQTGWSAPDYARFKFGASGKKYLVKMQVVLELDPLVNEDPAGLERFLNDFLPVFDKQIVGAGQTAGPAS